MKIQSINPHDQSIVGELEVSTTEEIKNAVNKAKEAFPSWKNLPIEKRVYFIKKFKDKIFENKEKIAKLTTLEMGKPIRDSLDDVDYELGFLDYYIENGPKILKDEVVCKNDNENFRISYEPFGVCACIAPWNYPLSMVNSGVIPALIAGNTVVFKPSEYTSLSQKLIIDLLNETGLLKGVLNLVIGGGEAGQTLIDEPVDLVWFTGSTKVGQEIYEKCGKKFIKALLEMGGSSPAIVFADADLNLTLGNLYNARFLNCGQICNAVKRLFVEKKVFEKVVKILVEKLEKVQVGNPVDENTDIGPLVSKKQLEKLTAQVEDAVSKGAKIEIGGKQIKENDLEKGNYFAPTILTNVKPDMRVLIEEVFGPVLPIVSFETEEEAIELANNTEYGLSAEVYSIDINKGERIAKEINAGTVAINTDNFFKPECPFGGFKKSGIGKEYGEVGMREFSKIKLIAVVK